MIRNRIQWLASLSIHALVLVVMASLTLAPARNRRIVRVDGVLEDPLPPLRERFLEMAPDPSDAIAISSSVDLLAPSQTDIIDGSKDDLNPLENRLRAARAFATGDRALERPLANAPRKLGLGGNLEGLRGEIASGGTGDAGSVDRITLEILRQLEKSKVLVAWVMDASGSLRQRREQVIRRFDRIYDELEKVGSLDEDALQTVVVAFGRETIPMTKKPISDRAVIAKAVSDIAEDSSGDENVFSAIRATALKYRAHQIHGRRTLMIIVLTDEIGDDPAQLDDTVALVERNRVPVYVLGPMAPFGRKEIMVRWTDKPTGEVFAIPIERGPETVRSEHLALPYWNNGPQYDLFPSGFGPYALTRLARESGGIYFLYDDGSMPGITFDVDDLLRYAPDYVSHAEYLRSMREHPLRAAVIKAVSASKGASGSPPTRFPASNIGAQLGPAQERAAATAHFVNRALSALRVVEAERDKEDSQRWRANYDLVMGRLLATKVRCDEYNWALAQMKTDPKTPTAKETNAWQLVGSSTIAFGRKRIPEKAQRKTNVNRPDSRATKQAEADAEQARVYLARVVTEHPDTPWALMAQRELEIPLGFAWRETTIAPPSETGPRASRQAAKKRRERRADAAKRLPRL